MDNADPMVDEVWNAIGLFVETLFGEASKDQVMSVLREQKPRQKKEEAELGRSLKSLAETLQKIYSTKFTVPLSEPTRPPAENSVMEISSEAEDDAAQWRELGERRKAAKDLVQITASKEEIDRRIAAFQRSKRAQIDERNRREFCNRLSDSDPECSCARVDAVFWRRAGDISRLRVMRVFNTQGPQTQAHASQVTRSGQPACSSATTAQVMESVAERLTSAEQHLKMSKDAEADIFSRLKALEERILFLEGLSLEYFRDGVPPPKRRQASKVDAAARDYSQSAVKCEYKSLSEIDQRIEVLQAKLREKMQHLSP